jgi:hypothetical protein
MRMYVHTHTHMQRAGLGVADDGCYDECHCLHLHQAPLQGTGTNMRVERLESDATLEMVSVLHTALMHVCLHPPRARAQYILTLTDIAKSHVHPCISTNMPAYISERASLTQPHAPPFLPPPTRPFPSPSPSPLFAAFPPFCDDASSCSSSASRSAAERPNDARISSSLPSRLVRFASSVLAVCSPLFFWGGVG